MLRGLTQTYFERPTFNYIKLKQIWHQYFEQDLFDGTRIFEYSLENNIHRE